MDIETARQKQCELEEKITDLCAEFERDTGLNIVGIDCPQKSYVTTNGVGRQLLVTNKARISVIW